MLSIQKDERKIEEFLKVEAHLKNTNETKTLN